jgi:ketosteroid isomerase-like protein
MSDEEIRQLDNEMREAMLARDIGALKRLCSDDFVVTNPFNRIINKQQMLEGVESGRIKHSVFERQIEYLRTYEGTAVVMGYETVIDDGPTIHRRYTEVWMMQDGRWQLIARHANQILA